MQHKFKPVVKLAVMAAALLCGNAMAQSSATLYGMVDAYVGATKARGADRAYGVNSGGMQTSYWGVKGTEDLGSGLKAIFDLNGFLRPDTGKQGRFDGDALFTRNAYVGLQDVTLGTVKFGRNTTPYFISTILFNPLVDSFVFSPAILHTYFSASNGRLYDPGIIGDSGWSNSVVYSTPNFGGLTANAMYSFGEQAGSVGKSKWGGNVLYFNGAFAATVAFQQVKFNSVPGDVTTPAALAGFDKQNAVQAGASYDFKVIKLFAQGQYIKSSVNNATGAITHTNGQVGASVPVGNGNALVSYAYDKTKNNVADFKRNTIGFAYDYNLSKRTDVYVAYFYDKLSGQPHGDSFGAGVRHRF
ncbi:porin [Cupriavidus sp. BIC8F]|uniref:porin n=1 Tax=Cupriavidus sp. BIC8F TaxID=3079014 RepID=UPI0039676E31